VALASALTGCGGEEGEPAARATPAPSVDPADVSPAGLPDIPEVLDAQGAIGDLSLGDCETQAGRRTVTGEVVSTATEAADYLVTLSWTTSDGDVMGRGFAVLRDVPPGTSERFTIKATVAEGATLCVPGLVHGTVV